MIGRPGANEGDTVAGSAVGASARGEPRWQALLAQAIRDPAELWRLLALPMDALPAALASARLFPLLVPRGFAALMRSGDLSDPLLRQIVPLAEEASPAHGYSTDPLFESGCSPVPGLLRKYRGRALLVTTGACAVHCRYCFRRHFPYTDLPRGRRWWDAALEEIARDPSIDELILSGGDPLMLPDEQLAAIARDAANIPHLTRLRVHSRLPVVLPERVDADCIDWLGATRLHPVVVIHANHPRELAPGVVGACSRLRAAGVLVLNQSVLLAGVNDAAAIIVELSERLFGAGVMPYYLHVLDRVQGAAHFLVEDERAMGIMRDVAAELPGYLVPRLVRERPGMPGKEPLHW